ncbi:MAG: methylated-DNA--[protein]-cysteine S-methyltransferase [Planctomycetota bacterium]
MPDVIEYTTFRTRWGHFGLASIENALLRTFLPVPDRQRVKTQILTALPNARREEGLFKGLQEQIIAYFEGTRVDFGPDVVISLDGLSPFSRSVLTASRKLTFGQTISYGGLAHKIGRPKAGRAIGTVMARNPTPLIIPCHRVIRSDGKIGGFSAAGGVTLKKRLLQLESEVE